jgi:hypothetical protein
VAARSARPFRLAVWLSAVAVIALNAGILLITLQTGYRVNAAAAGLDLY